MNKESYLKILSEKLVAIVQKFKAFITANIKKILIIGVIISLILNVILFLFGLNINYVNQNTNTQYQTSKNDVWSVNQNQNINLNLIFDKATFEGGKKLSYVTTNISTNALEGMISTLSYFQYLNMKVSVYKDRAFLFYPELNNSAVTIRSSATTTNIYTNKKHSTNSYKIKPYKLF